MSRQVPRPLVLVIDDESDHAEIVAALLERRGYVVATAPDGRTGVEVARRLHPDLVLLDICMPSFDGIATAEHLQGDAATSKVPIVFLSAIGELLDPAKLGAFLPKPFHAADLYRAVEVALGG